MNKLYYIFAIFILMLLEVPSFAVDLSKYNKLKNLETFTSENEIKIILNFSKPLKDIHEPQFFEKSIQFVFDKTYVVPAKRIFNIGEELIPDIHAYQYDQNSVRLRMFIGEMSGEFKNRINYEKKGNKLIISVSKKNKVLAGNSNNKNYEYKQESFPTSPLQRGNSRYSPFVKGERGDLNESEIETANKTKNLPLHIKQLQKISFSDFNGKEDFSNPIIFSSEKQKPDDVKFVKFNEKDGSMGKLNIDKAEKDIASNVSAPDLFSSSMKMVAALLIVLATMLVTYFFIKKFALKNSSFLGKNKLVNVHYTSYIGPKKYISLVEVAGEVLVLGITPTNITMLTKIDSNNIKLNQGKNKQTKSAFSKQLEKITAKADESKEKNNPMITLNKLIQEKIGKLKTA